MNLEFDQDKRNKTLVERGLNFADAAMVFEGVHISMRKANDREKALFANYLE